MTVDDYIAAIDKVHRRGDATEHSYRPALKALLESRAVNIEATNEPQRIAGNAPDFVVRRDATILGHVEAKDIGEPLEKLLKSPQLKRYSEALPNLIFTDYLAFVWLEHGEPKLHVRLGHLGSRSIVVAPDAESEWNKLSQAFYNAVAPTVTTPKQLAKLLAAQTQLLRDATLTTLRNEGETGPLAAQHKAFRELLVPELDDEEFADMFAQTVAYGLFTARVLDPTPRDFSLREAETLIPKASPFLRQLFRFIAFDLSDGVRWIAEQIVDPSYPVSGDHVVGKLRYEPSKDGTSGKVWINATQYFEGIDPETFAFRIGGYQVLEKWLKDRKKRALSIDDIMHYRKIAVALERTQVSMREIDVTAAPLFA